MINFKGYTAVKANGAATRVQMIGRGVMAPAPTNGQRHHARLAVTAPVVIVLGHLQVLKGNNCFEALIKIITDVNTNVTK